MAVEILQLPMKPYQTLVTMLSTITGRLTVSSHRSHYFKEAAFSSVTDQDLLLTR